VSRPCSVCANPEVASQANALREAGIPMREILKRVEGFSRDQLARHFRRHSKEQTSFPELDPLVLSDQELEVWRLRVEASYTVAVAQGDNRSALEASKLGARLAIEKRDRVHKQHQAQKTEAMTSKPTVEQINEKLRWYRAQKVQANLPICSTCGQTVVSNEFINKMVQRSKAEVQNCLL
jgi:hypothetical protein